MYLSRLLLNPRNRAVWRDLADCQAMHRTVMSGFLAAQLPGDARATLGVLHRVEVDRRSGSITLLVQSQEKPDWSRLGDYLLDSPGGEENPACKPLDRLYATIIPGMVLAFRLRANPTKKIDSKSGPDGERRNGRRVELTHEKDQIEWLRRKGEQGGFRLLEVRTSPPMPEAPSMLNVLAMPAQKVVGDRRNEHVSRITFGAVLFDGELEGTNAEDFRRMLETGIGT
ncbi:MAG: type I-E CRISPR-associated protein Cas6/Cse3/CasE, partial [Chloroflexi bacterium]|nr:type I-E CRISPR-associated protein Cas6/Cse3/CasE [Chloroflexota bacterium]